MKTTAIGRKCQTTIRQQACHTLSTEFFDPPSYSTPFCTVVPLLGFSTTTAEITYNIYTAVIILIKRKIHLSPHGVTFLHLTAVPNW